MSNPFAGTWIYRSFLNNPTPVNGDPAKLMAMLFAEAVWTIKDTPDKDLMANSASGRRTLWI